MAKKRILLIDDEEGFTRLVKMNLEKTGAYEIRTENKSRQAFAAAREFEPDLILLDVMMPGMDGGDVEAQIRRDAALAKTPVVFLTACVASKETAGGALVSGGKRFLAKPVSVERLIRCIEGILETTTPAPVACG